MHTKHNIDTPEWVKHAVFYQVYPDRFARSQKTPHPRGIQFLEWGFDPALQGFQGGDLYGVAEHLDDLKELGVTALYLNPIFSSACNHRYHTYDYFEVDPLLGGNEAFRYLLDEAHTRDMKVVLDGVFNHASRGFWAFHHILENGSESPYIDWFKIHDYPLNPYPRSGKEALNYDGWWGLPALPEFNHNNPGVRDYIFDVARHWMEFGIDGWRLDVADEIDDDEFWREFRTVVKSVKSDAYICGEVWSKAERWLQGDMFDSTMNYVFTKNVLSYFGSNYLHGYSRTHLEIEPKTTAQFMEAIDDNLASYDEQINQVQFNLLGSHDMARPLWILGENKGALSLCWQFLMTMPGAPCIYYGDEIAMSGGDDPDCRAAYPWDLPELQDQDMRDHVKALTTLRHRYKALRTGTFKFLNDSTNDVVSYQRKDEQHCLNILINRSEQPQTVSLPEGRVCFGELDTDGRLSAQSGVVIELEQ
ncbi:glycoside hydrolase family 13 protein [Endozoicomonas montiporae]|uniref:Putative glycoside hydrolase n=1 Tax=Endozoicomonas montiporae CL-33 TaxID=570277 RepID=A0A142B997_9GAMM|nr:glycoside hydrolase family 13 protein [Endozoicomonas montiporae]AMO55323.1 putative glycoside hydrolase [Endozoicomonas montiporae CL-33]